MDNMFRNHCKETVMKSQLQLQKDADKSMDKDYQNNGSICQHSDESNEKSQTASLKFLGINKDDSMLDFKSPPKKKAALLKVSNIKPICSKGKKNLKLNQKLIPERNVRKKILKQNNENLNSIQPFIESSSKSKCVDEMKEENDKVAHVCPLCFKVMKDENAHVMHMKSCAIKNRVSTKLLLDAVELQERQAEERKSLGLLAAPTLQCKKKIISHKPDTYGDLELQLGIALSKSLHEAEQINELDEMCALNGIPEQAVQVAKEGAFKESISDQWGFVTDQSAPKNTNNKTRKKKLCGFTILQTRSPEERDQILIERIAQVLVGNEIPTQNEQTIKCTVQHDEVVLKSRLLRKYYQTEGRLWDKTSLMKDQDDFYCVELAEHIRPIEKPLLNIDTKLNSVQQQKIEERIINPEDIKHNIQSITYLNVKNEEKENELGKQVQTIKTTEEHIEEEEEVQFVKGLIMDWRNALNDSSASDVIVFVSEDKHIWTHKLVYYVRCSNILLDIEPNKLSDPKFSSVKEKICWADITYNVALAFLEFIYCGFIKSWKRLINEPQKLSSVRCLARRYKVKDLFEYLRKMESKCEIVNVGNNTEIMENNNKVQKSANDLDSSPDDENENKSYNSNLKIQSTSAVQLITVNESVATETDSRINSNMKSSSEKNIAVSERVVSPDIFDDIEEEIVPNNFLQEAAQVSTQYENSHLNALLSLVNKDFGSDSADQEVSNCATESLSSSTKGTEEQSKNNESAFMLQMSAPVKLDNYVTSNVTNPKGDISMFIEKIQRHNEKSVYDFDSKIDTPVNRHSKLYRNPFNVNWGNESETDSKIQDTSVEVGNLLRKPSALSMLENDVHGINMNVCKDFKEDFKSFADESGDLEFNKNNWPNHQLTAGIPTEDVLSENEIIDEKTEVPVSKSNSDLVWNSTNNENRIMLAKSEVIQQLEETNFTSLSQSVLKKNIESVSDRVNVSTSFCIKNVTDDSTNFTVEAKDKKYEFNKQDKIVKSPKMIKASASECSFLEHKEHRKNSHTSNSSQEDDENNEAEDEELQDISVYTKYKKNHLHNSIANYRAALMRHLIEEEDQNNSCSNLHMEDVEVNVTNNANRVEADYSEIYDIDMDIEEETGASSLRNDHPLSQKIANVSKSSEKVVLTSNEDSQTSFKTEDVYKNIQEESNIDLNTSTTSNKTKFVENERIGTPSPVLVSSGLNDLDVEYVGTQHLSDSYNMEINKSSDSDTDDELYTFFYQDLNLANVHTSSDKVNELPHLSTGALQTSLNCDLIDNPNITVNRKRDKFTLKGNNNEIVNINSISDKESNNGNVSLVSDEWSKQNSKCIRQFKVKSVSDDNISSNKSCIGGKSIRRFSSTQTSYKKSLNTIVDNVSDERSKSKKSRHDRTPNANSLQVNQQSTPHRYKDIPNSKDFIITDKDVTPPPDYEKKSTPELHREMKKYGLKLQKRSRAVKLLNFIYNETHPLVPVSDVSDMIEKTDEREDLPTRKLSQHRQLQDKQDCDLLTQNSDASMESVETINSAEREYDEPDSTPMLDNAKTIEEAFSMIISSDRNLHNKILMYEPLNLAQLHTALKTIGFKCKLNSLMDFLDGQCILFSVPEDTVKSSRRR